MHVSLFHALVPETIRLFFSQIRVFNLACMVSSNLLRAYSVSFPVLVSNRILFVSCNMDAVWVWSNLQLIVSVCLPFYNFKIPLPKLYLSQMQHAIFCTFIIKTEPCTNKHLCNITCLFIYALWCVWWRVHIQIYCKLLHFMGVFMIRRRILSSWLDLHVNVVQLTILLVLF